MFSTKLFLAIVLIAGVSARHVPWEEVPYGYDEEYRYPEQVDQGFEYQHPGYLASVRTRRQAEGRLTLNSDGSTGVNAKIPLARSDNNVLSAIGSAGLDSNMNLASKGIGLSLDNIAKGHGASVMRESVPGFGSKLTGAGHATLFHNDKHDLGANAFITKNIPSNYPGVPNFNTVGGGVDYKFDNKVGASLGMAHTPFLDRKDYSAMGTLNLFRNPTTTVDFGAGFKRFDTPFMNSGWKPNFAFSLGKTF